jgi:hypothetical protein
MIGVIADDADRTVVHEFFELFKTPWEQYSTERKYDVVLCDGTSRIVENAKVVLVYSGRKLERDGQDAGHTPQERKGSRFLSYDGNRIPVYGDSVTFAVGPACFLLDEESRECAGYLEGDARPHKVRIGYDLFDEVRVLLTVGQPAANAPIPTLDLHISLIRDIIVACGVTLIEIPPVPVGYGCIVCLTHDVDHPSIRLHGWDHTILGFLYRATVGSAINLFRGRIPVSDFFTNWLAALKLPLVYLGLAQDFWRGFDDTYLKIEGGLRSTYFVIPFKKRPGVKAGGPAPAIRAAAYGAGDISNTVRKLNKAGCEVALHGIDAWIDSSKGRGEIEVIRELTGDSNVGVRMHWLYSDQNSPAVLEAAGAAYDSTSGYNETVGYRAGTTQVFKPLNASQMLELPLHAMDTALFYPSYLGLCEDEAKKVVAGLADNSFRFGGTLTVNWHDRSPAPERLWGGCYESLIQDLKNRGVWFATAGQAVSWFQKRRSASFDELEGAAATCAGGQDGGLPGLRLRTHHGQTTIPIRVHHAADYDETPLNAYRAKSITSATAI